MNIYPAIDLYEGKAVRLYKGEYSNMTVYNNDPLKVAADFESKNAKYMHIVDLEGAKSGLTPNFETVKKISMNTDLFIELGGGIRSIDVIDKYLNIGIDRVILGTAAVTNEVFLKEAINRFDEKIAVGVDIKDGFVAISGWTLTSEYTCEKFCEKIQNIGVTTLICTDISRDGAMKGTNRVLYKDLSQKFSMDIIASGGISDIEDIRKLRSMDLSGAIIGKAYYTGALDLREAIEVAK